MVVDHLPGARDPLAARHPWYVLLEFSSGRSEADAQELAENTLAEALSQGIIADAAIAASLEQAKGFWRMRHGITEVQRHEGASIKHDVSVPVQRVPEFLERAIAAVSAAVPGIRPVPFGHMGDGNIHFNASQPPAWTRSSSSPARPRSTPSSTASSPTWAARFPPSTASAATSASSCRSVKSDIELDLMRRIKRAFDPNDILNPGRVI